MNEGRRRFYVRACFAFAVLVKFFHRSSITAILFRAAFVFGVEVSFDHWRVKINQPANSDIRPFMLMVSPPSDRGTTFRQREKSFEKFRQVNVSRCRLWLRFLVC
jgi:hypothetical protein